MQFQKNLSPSLLLIMVFYLLDAVSVSILPGGVWYSPGGHTHPCLGPAHRCSRHSVPGGCPAPIPEYARSRSTHPDTQMAGRKVFFNSFNR